MIGEERAIGIKLTNPGSVDWYYGSGNTAYSTVADALTTIPAPVRLGKTVAIKTGDTIVEYWFSSGTTDSDLVIKDRAGIFAFLKSLPGWAENKVLYGDFHWGTPPPKTIQVNTYADMQAALVTDDPTSIIEYIVKSDESNGGVIGHYTHYNNSLTFFIEGDSK